MTAQAPRAVARTLFLPAGAFAATAGTPSIGAISSRWRAFTFDDAGGKIVGCEQALPAFWVSMDVDLYWSNTGTAPSAGADTVRWNINLDRAGDGDLLTSSGGGGTASVSLVSPAANTLKVSRVFTAQAVDPTKLYNLRVERDSAHAEDTLLGDARFLGLRLRRNSASSAVDL